MIVFDLRCGGGHVFEAWFASSTAFDDQRERRLVACPVCGADEVEKAVMAPNVAAKSNSVDPAARAKSALVELGAELAAAQARVLAGSRWVGRRFAEEARSMHAGDAPEETIHGQATRDEAIALIEEGVAIAPLPFPVAPPESLN